jgi:hypothetical protein
VESGMDGFILRDEAGIGIGISDPRRIRSVNAAFDPARSDSANLLAANAKQGAAVPLAIDAAERAQPSIRLKGSNGLAQIMRGDEPIGYVKYGVDGNAATIHDIKTYDGSNALGLSGLRELREAFREIAPDVKTFQGVREPTMKTGAARQGADASGYGERRQSVDLYSNASTGAAIPAGMEASETDPALVEYLKAIGLY